MASFKRTLASRPCTVFTSEIGWGRIGLVGCLPKPFPAKSLPLPQGLAHHLQDEYEARVWWIGWGRGGRNIESTLQFSLYLSGNDVAPKARFYLSEAKNSRGQGRARGPEKNPRLRRLYLCIRPDKTPYI